MYSGSLFQRFPSADGSQVGSFTQLRNWKSTFLVQASKDLHMQKVPVSLRKYFKFWFEWNLLNVDCSEMTCLFSLSLLAQFFASIVMWWLHVVGQNGGHVGNSILSDWCWHLMHFLVIIVISFSITRVKHCCSKIIVTGILLRQLLPWCIIMIIPAAIPLLILLFWVLSLSELKGYIKIKTSVSVVCICFETSFLQKGNFFHLQKMVNLVTT